MTTPLRIAFYYYGRVLRPGLHRAEPLGGTESALLILAESLAARGHQVRIYGNEVTPADVDGVAYRPISRCKAECTPTTIDCFIVVRHLLPHVAGRFGAQHWLWTPDAHDQPFLHQAFQLQFDDQRGERYSVGLYGLAQIAPWIDRIVCVGHWQAATITQRFGLRADHCWVGYNGIDTARFAAAALPLAHRQRQLVYTSTPYRGLEYLVDLFPEIRAQVPDARAVICSSMQVYGASVQDDQHQFGALYQRARQLGMILTGSLVKADLAAILGQSRVCAYPNTFAETFCIAVAEAQAAGVPAVTTQIGALPERIASGESGWLIAGHPSDPAYRAAFVQHVVQLLTDDEQWTRMSVAAQAAVAPHDAAAQAAAWEHEMRRALAVPVAPPPAFTLQPQQQDILVNGYPKHVDLPVALQQRYLAQVLQLYGFTPSKF